MVLNLSEVEVWKLKCSSKNEVIKNDNSSKKNTCGTIHEQLNSTFCNWEM